MHTTALSNCQCFFETYVSLSEYTGTLKIVDIGSQDINGSLRQVAPSNAEYIGVDFASGKGVDIILNDPYSLPFETGSVDIVLSSSCFEHSEMFWVSFLEILRVLKPSGLFYLNVPSNGSFHRYPVDCWRFYPDSGKALETWANRNGIDAVLLESYTSAQEDSIWNDFVAIFLKDKACIDQYYWRILDDKTNITNGIIHGTNEMINPSRATEDQIKLRKALKQIF